MKIRNLHLLKAILLLALSCSFTFIHLNAQFSGDYPFIHERGGIIINEISNGPTASEDEYIEFLVVGAPNNPDAPVDISGWLIDDNNFAGTGEGNAPGHLIFGRCYTAVPPGSLLVVYNAASPNALLPPDDPEDANNDGAYIIPNTSACMDACPSNPNIEDSNFCPCADPEATVSGWQFGLRNAGDIVQVRDRCETIVHAISWGSVSLTAEVQNTVVRLRASDNSQSGRVIRFINALNNDWNTLANYDNPEVDGNQTPGQANSPENQSLISELRAGSFSATGTILDCRATDAGDLVLPADAPSTTLPLQLCSGEDLSAFTPSYEAEDEIQPTPTEFAFEYAYLLTSTNAPDFTILEFNLDGDFDFNALPNGEYLVWGFSFIQTNGSMGINDFLNKENISTVEDIRQYRECGFDGNVDVRTASGDSLKIVIGLTPATPMPIEVPGGCISVGDEFDFNLTALEDNFINNADQEVRWYLDSTAQNPIENPANFTSGTTRIFATLAEFGCESEALGLDLQVFPSPTIDSVDFNNETCGGFEDGSIFLSFSGGSSPFSIFQNGQLTISTSEMAFLQDNLSAGTYTFIVENKQGCQSAPEMITLFEGSSISIDMGPDTTISLGESVAIMGISDFDIQEITWNPSNGINPPNSLNVTASPQVSTTYIITATDTSGCIALDSLTIIVEGSKDVFIPNVFSPNGDGINDQFNIFADFSFYNLEEIHIFNRWGAQLFESGAPIQSSRTGFWDGTYNGEPVEIGTYVYYVVMSDPNGESFIFSGSVNVIR